jgi:hypothetical protein
MRNRIFGGIGVVWGGWILIAAMINGLPQGQGAYVQGQWIGLGFGVLMFGAGLYYLIKGDGASTTGKSKSGKSSRARRN